MYSKISYDNFRFIFSKFCFESYVKQKIEFTNDELRDYFKYNYKDFDIDSFIKDLIYSVCVLYQEGI
jgi:hypothetical protein